VIDPSRGSVARHFDNLGFIVGSGALPDRLHLGDQRVSHMRRMRLRFLQVR